MAYDQLVHQATPDHVTATHPLLNTFL